MRRRPTLGFVRFRDSAPTYFKLFDMVLEDAGGNGYYSRPIISRGARTRLDVCEVGRRTGLGPQAEKENVYTAQRIKFLQVSFQFSFEISGVGLYRREALHLLEERLAKQSLEVSHKAETIIHPHWRECVLSEHVKPTEQIVSFIGLCHLSQNRVQSLRAASAEQQNYQVAFSFSGSLLNLLQLRATNRLFRFQNFVMKSTRL